MADAQPTSLYRYYDAAGVLLYAGITSRGAARNFEHDTSKPWWGYVARQEVDHFLNRADALAAERRTIRLYRPPFNIQHNPDHQPARDAYLAASEVMRLGLTPVMVNAHGRRLALALVHHEPSEGGQRLIRWYRSQSVAGPLVALIDVPTAAEEAVRVGVGNAGKFANARVWRDGDALLARVSSASPGAPPTATARLKFLSQKPVVLAVATVSVTGHGH